MLYPEIGAARARLIDDHDITVFEVARRLRRYAYIEWHMVKTLGAWLPTVPEWDIKHAFGRMLWEDAEHCSWLRGRLQAIRGGRVNEEPGPRLHYLMQEVIHAGNSAEFIAGFFLILKGSLVKAYQQHLAETNPILDAPSHSILRRVLVEEEAHVTWARERLSSLLERGTEMDRRPVVIDPVALDEWQTYVGDLITGAGGIIGLDPEQSLPKRPDRQPYSRPTTPAREMKYHVTRQFDPFPDQEDLEAWRVYRFAMFMNEMMASETLGAILYDASDMPWEFYHDMARHCWDELRHSQMGQKRLEELGYDLDTFARPVHNYEARLRMGWVRAFCHLTMLSEAPAMKSKRPTMEYLARKDDQRSATYVDYDWSDEGLHVRYGHKWLSHLFDDDKEKLDEFIAETQQRYEEYFQHVPMP